jgi:uncharacterized protein YabN with tetrapyrrole methylase and pyrophosphatase domain
MKKFQERVQEFNDKRNWSNENEMKRMKDFLMNMCEEAGEAWSIIKWVDDTNIKELVEKHKDEYEDFIGDQLFLILKIANIAGVDSEKALERTLNDYEKRFPVKEAIEKKHGNVLAGGIDNK